MSRDVTNNHVNQPQLDYFAAGLPWQADLWQHLTNKSVRTSHDEFVNTQDNQRTRTLPHAILASGMAGIGKRAFVWRWVAWQLCHNRHQSEQVACGHCESCRWLKAGTHPDLYVLPDHCLPTYSANIENNKTSQGKKPNKPTKPQSQDKSLTSRIKIDDIRAIQDFVNHGSSDVRFCVFDYADTMTTSASNALLKTLEEPRAGVQLILISDRPSLLLPTIKSRVQKLPMGKIDGDVVVEFVSAHLRQSLALESNQHTLAQVRQLLSLSGYAPLSAIAMAHSVWYPLRGLWIKTWLALRQAKRQPVEASDYWQQQISLHDFIRLTRIMLADILRLSHNLPTYQLDVDFSSINTQNMPKSSSLHQFELVLQEIEHSLKQNVQDKMAYDKLMESLSVC